jgi:uncharacterized surface protein with fasciclin (FAS1) repeats
MQDFYKTLVEVESLHSLVNAMGRAGLVETLNGAGPYTLFAPDDIAFTRMLIGDELDDPDKLKSILTYHLVPGRYTTEDIREMENIETMNGNSLTIGLDDDELVIDDGKFITSDIECSNGIIHIIDTVFKPQLAGWYREAA